MDLEHKVGGRQDGICRLSSVLHHLGAAAFASLPFRGRLIRLPSSDVWSGPVAQSVRAHA